MKYRGVIRNRLTHELRKTRWYETYKDAHDRAELLGRRLYGRNDNWTIDCIDVEEGEE